MRTNGCCARAAVTKSCVKFILVSHIVVAETRRSRSPSLYASTRIESMRSVFTKSRTSFASSMTDLTTLVFARSFEQRSKQCPGSRMTRTVLSVNNAATFAATPRAALSTGMLDMSTPYLILASRQTLKVSSTSAWVWCFSLPRSVQVRKIEN